MGSEEIWRDPRTWITVVSTGFGVLGWLLAVLSFFWNRAESRRKALTEVLEPLASMAQHLVSANQDRRRYETLEFSFPPDRERPPEAAERIGEFHERYSQSMKEATEKFQSAQAGFASRCFRFPDRIARLIDRSVGNLAESGRLVNIGLFERAELELASFRDNYAQILRDARGWRLMDPLEGLKGSKRDSNDGS